MFGKDRRGACEGQPGPDLFQRSQKARPRQLSSGGGQRLPDGLAGQNAKLARPLLGVAPKNAADPRQPATAVAQPHGVAGGQQPRQGQTAQSRGNSAVMAAGTVSAGTMSRRSAKIMPNGL